MSEITLAENRKFGFLEKTVLLAEVRKLTISEFLEKRTVLVLIVLRKLGH